MGLLQIEAEIENKFIASWTAAPIQLQDRPTFDYASLTSWIAIQYNPVLNNQIGFDGTTVGRNASYGQSVVYCYHKQQKLALKLADDVKAFFIGTELPYDIHVGNAQDGKCINLDNGLWEVKLNFSVVQYS